MLDFMWNKVIYFNSGEKTSKYSERNGGKAC